MVRPRVAPGRLRWGLRGRLVAALVVASVATLIAATLTVVPLLEKRLEHERLSDLRGLVLTARPALASVPDEELRADSPPLRRLVERLQRRAGGRIVVFDAAGRALVDTTPLAHAPAILGLEQIRSRALRNRDGVTSGEQGRLAFALAVAREGDARVTLVIAKRLDDTRAAARVVRTGLPLEFAVGLAVALTLALLLSRGLLGRLARLRGDALALSTEGLDHHVEVTAGDEVGDVARALEAMRVRLVEEDASRQAFIATASHELRTPLASLQVTLELLQEQVSQGTADPRQTAASAETALRQTHRLVALATELLDLSRVDGDVELRLEPIDVNEIAELVAHEFADRAAVHGRALEVAGDRTVAVADPTAVARILRVLLDNAFSYGDGTVTLTTTAAAELVLVKVADEGPGVAADERERVFMRFTRGRVAGSAPGAGLGLSIARGLAKSMGGGLESIPARRGALFELTLPGWSGDREEQRTAHSSAL